MEIDYVEQRILRKLQFQTNKNENLGGKHVEKRQFLAKISHESAYFR